MVRKSCQIRASRVSFYCRYLNTSGKGQGCGSQTLEDDRVTKSNDSWSGRDTETERNWGRTY